MTTTTMDEEIITKILNILKEGEKSTSEVSSIINRNYYQSLSILEKLFEENKIEKIEKNKYTFWRINDGI